MKKYLPDFSNNNKKNFIGLILGILGVLGVLIVSNILGFKIPVFNHGLGLQRWLNCNPFLLIIAVSLFNLFRQYKSKISLINYISSSTLLIYLIHENLIVRTYLRPWIWEWVFIEYGYQNIIIFVLIYSIAFFMISLLISIFYKNTIHRMCSYIWDKKLKESCSYVCGKIIEKLIKLK